MQPIFTYNQESAQKAGLSGVQTGANVFTITQAQWRQHNGYQSLNFELDCNGAKAFIDLTYQGADGKPWNANVNHINAIMGVAGVQQLTSAQVQSPNGAVYIAPELTGKSVGLVTFKRLYSKNDGSDGTETKLAIAFNPATGQTMKEQLSNEPASAVSKIVESLVDKDDRKKGAQQQQGGYNQVPPSYDDDIAF